MKAEDTNYAMQVGGSSNTSVVGAIKRHDSLYIDDDTVVLLVENTLYRVHRYFLRQHSKVFLTMFSLPPETGKPEEGQTDEHPIHLYGVASQDFERFLSLFYPDTGHDIATTALLCSGDPAHDDQPFIHRNINGDLSTVEEWTSVLSLSTHWEFPSYRKLALSRLAQLASPVDRILLGRRYDVTEWLAPAFLELCTRDESLTIEEGQKLGMEDVVLLADIRQGIRGSSRVTMHERNIAMLIEKKLALA